MSGVILDNINVNVLCIQWVQKILLASNALPFSLRRITETEGTGQDVMAEPVQ
jgi:hypothetical protein